MSRKYDCEFYDFNLLKNKNELFPLNTAFYDWLHLSGSGAETFSKEFVRLIKKVDGGEDVSSFFFNSYVEADANSIYAK